MDSLGSILATSSVPFLFELCCCPLKALIHEYTITWGNAQMPSNKNNASFSPLQNRTPLNTTGGFSS